MREREQNIHDIACNLNYKKRPSCGWDMRIQKNNCCSEIQNPD